MLNPLCRDSKLTMLLRESLGNINCRTTMITHISDSPADYAESLTTIQLASRIHRMRKKKSKVQQLVFHIITFYKVMYRDAVTAVSYIFCTLTVRM